MISHLPMKTNLTSGVLHGLLPVLIWIAGPLAGPSAAGEGPSAAGEDAQASRSITVHLASGRTLIASVDQRTDQTHLWLRWERGSAVLRRPIRWDRVVRAELRGADLSGNQLQEMVTAVRREVARGSGGAAQPGKIAAAGSAEPSPSIPPFGAAAPTTPDPDPDPDPVRSLAIDAWVANWDADVEVDGLVLEIHPLDSGGALVPVRGVLEVELHAERAGQPSARLGRWTRAVRVDDFGSSTAVYRLPFQAIHPESDLGVGSYAAVCVRLSVPGQGTFAATAAEVRIRPYSSARANLYRATGRRFFPGERTGAAVR